MFTKNQIISLCVTSIILLAVLMFPPFFVNVEGEAKNLGYSFILSPPKQEQQVVMVNSAKLVIQWLAVMLYGCLAFILSTDPQASAAYSQTNSILRSSERTNPFPSHPWIRLWARAIDYVLFLVVYYLLIFILSTQGAAIRFSENLMIDVLIWPMLANAPLAFYEAFWISTIATTPGKALFCIRVLTKDGAKLSFPQALARAFSVIIHGFAFFLPLLPITTLWSSYKEIKLTGVAYWDKREKNQIAHSSLKTSKILIGSCLGFIAAVAISATPLVIRKIFHKETTKVEIENPAQPQYVPPPNSQNSSKKTIKKILKEILPASPKKLIEPPAIPHPSPLKPTPPPESIRSVDKIPEPPPEIKPEPPQYQTMLDAVNAKDIPALKEFIKQGGNINEKIDGTTLLIAAIKREDVDTVKWLVENGADTNQMDSDGRTPYLYAQISNNETILSLVGGDNSSGNSEIMRWQHKGDTWVPSR